MVEDTYEVFNTNGMYYHSPVSDIYVDPPCFPSTFLSTERSLASPHSFLDSNTCIVGPHHHAADCLLSHGHRREDSDSPFHISLADLLNASALWATSLTSSSCSSHDLYHFNVSPSHSPVGLCLGMSPRMLYTPLSSLRYSIPCYGNDIMSKSQGIYYLMISYYPSLPHLCQCVCPLFLIV